MAYEFDVFLKPDTPAAQIGMRSARRNRPSLIRCLKTFGRGGGTDMGAGIVWLNENGVEPDVCVVLTDGYTPWPARAPDFPLAVLCTTDQQIPYGELIPYRMDDEDN